MNSHNRLHAEADLHVRVTDFAATTRDYRWCRRLPSSWTAPRIEGNVRGCRSQCLRM